MTTNTPVVAPCPFCGSVPSIRPTPNSQLMVECINRSCTVSPFVTAETEGQAIAHWNKRSAPTHPALGDDIQTLREFADAVFGRGVGSEPNVYADYDELCDWSRRVREALSRLAAPNQWRSISEAPRDQTVLVTVVPTRDNKALPDWPPRVHPAYIDPHGMICDSSTWGPDQGLNGAGWQATHWMPLPAPPSPEASHG